MHNGRVGNPRAQTHYRNNHYTGGINTGGIRTVESNEHLKPWECSTNGEAANLY
jgi:hypothetical protein